eukprot:Colp12_sorted_trinity150504_noHs@5174
MANLTPYSNFTVEGSPCFEFLRVTIPGSDVPAWDLLLFLPAFIFFIYLTARLRVAIANLRVITDVVVRVMYGLVWAITLLSVVRSCVAAASYNRETLSTHNLALWLLLRFSTLCLELSVVLFGILFENFLRTRQNTWTPLTRTSLIFLVVLCLIHTGLGAAIEVLDNGATISQPDAKWNVYVQGGMILWFATSLFFIVIYMSILLIPCSWLRRSWPLPDGPWIKAYVVFMLILHTAQALGSALVFFELPFGFCLLDGTSFVYFGFLCPLVYGVFLHAAVTRHMHLLLPTALDDPRYVRFYYASLPAHADEDEWPTDQIDPNTLGRW